jgi:hypothetical protein
MKVFLSHSNRDKALVREIRRQLPGHIRTWLDEDDLLVGQDLNISIKSAIQQDADFVVVFLGKEAVASEWVKLELEWALEHEKKIGRVFVLPVLLDDVWNKVEPTEFQNRLYIKCIDQREDAVREAARELIDSIFSWLSRLLDESKRAKDQSHIFDHSDGEEFPKCFRQLASKAKQIVLIGIGLNILHRDPIYLHLIERVKSGQCNIEIYLANPFSPAVEVRLIEEEIGNMKPPVGKSGLVTRLRSIIEEQRRMGTPSNFVLRVFPNYPTFAMIILDDDYFFYPYGHALLGNQSPVFHFSKNNPANTAVIEFLQRQYKDVKASSASAQLIIDALDGQPASVKELLPFAVYLVPNASSDIYKFGSKVLGYDLRNSCGLMSPWTEYVGSAADFGFHLTIADALYYPCQRDIDLLCKEVEFVARDQHPRDLHPFSLRFEMKERFPNENSISLVCYDESGTLETLHYELVFRCYRQAVASNYSLRLAAIDRDSILPKDRLMIKRYHAPYILQRFNPHFTLLTNVPAGKMDEVAQKLNELIHQEVKEEQIDIKHIALMTKPQDQHWQILHEVQLR